MSHDEVPAFLSGFRSRSLFQSHRPTDKKQSYCTDAPKAYGVREWGGTKVVVGVGVGAGSGVGVGGLVVRHRLKYREDSSQARWGRLKY